MHIIIEKVSKGKERSSVYLGAIGGLTDDALIGGPEWARDELLVLISTRPRGRFAAGMLNEARDWASASTFCGGE